MQELEALISNPRESETVEYKGWLDLHSKGTNTNPATLAKALIAMRNSGGGHVVLGFADNANEPLVAEPKPNDYADFDSDVVQAVIKRYADPEFHCELDVVLGHPVVSVPAGVPEPVITRAGSPDNQVTLKHGKYYVRCPGPESREPRNGLEWKNLIGRCVANNRDEIVNRIIPVLRQLESLEVIEVVGKDTAIDRIDGLLDD